MMWKNQMLNTIIARGFEQYIDGTCGPPPQFLDELMTEINPAYKTWQWIDRAVQSWLYSSLTTEPMGHIVSCRSSYEIWESL